MGEKSLRQSLLMKSPTVAQVCERRRPLERNVSLGSQRLIEKAARQRGFPEFWMRRAATPLRADGSGRGYLRNIN